MSVHNTYSKDSNGVEKLPKGVSKRVRMYREDYISVSIYLNITPSGHRYYDTVVYRKIPKRDDKDSFEWVRGANFKPFDLPILQRLLKEAEEFLSSKMSEECR